MALSPEVEINLPDEEETPMEPLTTYRIDYETGEITNEIIDGTEAVQQAVHMALQTPRFSHFIYSDDYGSEIAELLADNEVTEEFKMMELPRMIEEALIYDDRISEVTDFEIEQVGDSFHVKFTVVSDEGILEVEEVFG